MLSSPIHVHTHTHTLHRKHLQPSVLKLLKLHNPVGLVQALTPTVMQRCVVYYVSVYVLPTNGLLVKVVLLCTQSENDDICHSVKCDYQFIA